MEFVDVMRAQERMCDSYEYCDNCPLHSFHCGPNTCKNVTELSRYERIVADWAEANPAYPTIGELFEYIREAMGISEEIPFDDVADRFIPPQVAKDIGLMPISDKYAVKE